MLTEPSAPTARLPAGGSLHSPIPPAARFARRPKKNFSVEIFQMVSRLSMQNLTIIGQGVSALQGRTGKLRLRIHYIVNLMRNDEVQKLFPRGMCQIDRNALCRFSITKMRQHPKKGTFWIHVALHDRKRCSTGKLQKPLFNYVPSFLFFHAFIHFDLGLAWLA